MVRYCLLRNGLFLLNGSCLSICSFSRKKQNRAGGPSSTSRVTQSGNTLFLKPTCCVTGLHDKEKGSELRLL